MFICWQFSCSSENKNPISHFHFQKSSQQQQRTLNADQYTQHFFIMEKFLLFVEPAAQADELEMDPEKLKFFNSKLKVWDFPKISLSKFQSLSFDDKSNLLKKYYVEMLARYTEGKDEIFCCCFLVIFWYCFLAEIWLKFSFAWAKFWVWALFVCRQAFECFQEGNSCFN